MIEDEFGVTDQYIRARQYDPKDFDKETFRTIRLAPSVKAIVGNLLGDNELVAQSIIFKRDRFDEMAATQWLKRNLERIQEAIMLENQKVGLFEEEPATIEEVDVMEQHLQGHLPPLSEWQIQKLLELIGSEPVEEEIIPPYEEYYKQFQSRFFKRL